MKEILRRLLESEPVVLGVVIPCLKGGTVCSFLQDS